MFAHVFLNSYMQDEYFYLHVKAINKNSGPLFLNRAQMINKEIKEHLYASVGCLTTLLPGQIFYNPFTNVN